MNIYLAMTLTESLFSEVENLRITNQGYLLELQNKSEKITHLEGEVSHLHEVIRELKRLKFGRRSERWETEEQVLLFNEVEAECRKPESEPEHTDAKSSSGKKRGHRRALPKELPREIVEITLPPEEQVLADGTKLKPIGKEISEKIIYEPSVIKVVEYHRIKYGVDSGDYIKTALPVPSIIPKGIATPELLASIITSKYADGLPLYRQEEIFERFGIDLYRSTMARWVVQAAEACRPVWNILSDRLHECFYVACDETHVQVLKEKGRAPESESWMWVRATPYGKHRIVLFDYDPSRSGEVVQRLFADYKGILQVDGYSAYNVLGKNKEILEIGCNMHGRRYFEKARTVGAKSGQSLAETGLKFYKLLYDIEEELKEKPPDERYKMRLEKSQPIWDEFKKWTDQNQAKVPPKSKIGQAFHYFLAQYPHLTGYLRDGRLEMDNGFVERAIRKFAIGRNNWMFSDTEAGAEASSLFYSLLVTAKLNSVNPYKVLKTIFTEIPKAKSLADIEYLADLILAVKPLP